MKRNAVKICVASILLAGLAGCGGGGGGSGGGGTVAVSGVAQGPLVSGTVTIQNVTSPITTSALGVFSATVPSNSNVDLTATTATGGYFDEVLGKVSTTSSLTLNSFASSADTALNINILTTLAYQRIKSLMAAPNSLSFSAARTQAEKEVLAAFYIRDQNIYNFGSLNLSTSPPGRDEDHILAAITSIFENGGTSYSGGLSGLVSDFQTEMATNSGSIITSQILSALSATGINPTTVAANLTTEYKAVSASLYSSGDISDWLDQDGDHVIGKYKFKAIQAAANLTTANTFPPFTVGASDNGATYSFGSNVNNPNAIPNPTCKFNGFSTKTVNTGNSISVTCTPTVVHEASTTYLQSLPSLPTVPVNLTTPINIARYDFTPFATVASLATTRTDATVTLLKNTRNHDGQVLVTGGLAGSTPAATASVELYDPVNDKWISGIKPMNTARDGHTATMLNNGLVLVVGGDATGKVATAELYDPDTNTWTNISTKLSTGHRYHSATLLQDGNVLIVGGITYTAAAAPATGTPTGPASVELFTLNPTVPASSTWSTTFGTASTSLALVPTQATPFTTTAGATTFTGTVSATLPVGYRSHHTATLLQNGMVLIWGGFNGSVAIADAELFDPGDIANVDTSGTPSWAQVIPTSGTLAAIYSHTATLSTDGTTVLIAGGIGVGGLGTLTALNQISLYNSATNTLNFSSLINARSNHIAQPVVDSSGALSYVLIAGGANSSALKSAELCDFNGSCNTNGNLTYARSHFGAVMLNNGNVLLVGGASVSPAETFQ